MATSHRYFSPAVNRLVPRHGTGAFIGAVRTKTGFVIDSDVVVPIPEQEVRANLLSYNKCLKPTPRRGPSLIEKTREDYIAYAEKKGFDPISDAKYPEKKRTRSSAKKSETKKKIEPIEPIDGGEEHE